MANEKQGFLVVSACEGEAFLRLEGPVCATVEAATEQRDVRRKQNALARVMVRASHPSRKPPPSRWYCVIGAVSDAETQVSDEEIGEAVARSAALRSVRQQPASPPPVALSSVAEGTSGAYPREERRE